MKRTIARFARNVVGTFRTFIELDKKPVRVAPRALRHDNIYKEAQMSQVSKLVRLKTVIATNSSLFSSITVDAVP